jgi:predicted branched-subunit amino acid permease
VPAAFLALLAPQLRDRTALRVALAGALLAVASVPFVRPGVPVLVAALAVVPAVVRR